MTSPPEAPSYDDVAMRDDEQYDTQLSHQSRVRSKELGSPAALSAFSVP
jgi:hypothetical protein